MKNKNPDRRLNNVQNISISDYNIISKYIHKDISIIGLRDLIQDNIIT
jgi:hypothetical protein